MAGNDVKRGPLLSLVSEQKDLLFYAKEVEGHPGPVLVLGAGTGRLPWELAHRGVRCVAVEPSEVMLQTAQARKQAEPASASDLIEWHEMDVRAVRLSQRFSVVLAPQNALAMMATLDDLDALLATVRHHLEPDGVFCFDVLNPYKDALRPPHDPEEGWHPLEGVEPPRPVFAPHLRERSRREDGVHEGIRRLRLRHFSVSEVDQALREAGFVATLRFGDFDRRPFESSDSMQVVVAVRDLETTRTV